MVAQNSLERFTFVCFKLLLPCRQMGNNAWEWSYGKHDDQDYNRIEYCLGGNYIGQNFLDCNNPGGDFLVGNFPGGSYPGWEFSGWELSGWELSWVGVILGGNFLCWEFSGWELSRGNHPDGNFSGGSFPSTRFKHTENLEFIFLK